MPNPTIKPPSEASSLDDIRVAIDSIDHDIVRALALRMRYVERASHFKATEADIPAPDRVAAMLPERRRWAEDAGIDGDFVHALYDTIIHWYIDTQIRYWRAQRGLP